MANDNTTVEYAQSLDGQTLRKVYSAQRSIAQKRLQRLGESYSKSKAYQRHRDGFAKLKDIDPRDLPKALSEVMKFLSAKSSSASGQRDIRRRTIETWQSQGLNLNQKNYDKAIDILEEMRKRKIVYGSDKVIEVADAMLEVDDVDGDEWLEHIETLLEHSDELDDIIDSYHDVTDSVSIDDIFKELGE